MIIYDKSTFKEWFLINDTIMGGKSNAELSVNNNGLFLKGNLIEEGGGFVSCRSPNLIPPLNLSDYEGFIIEIESKSASIKFAVSCEDKLLSIQNFLTKGLRWVSVFNTNEYGPTKVKIPFKDLEPSIRAKKVILPVSFNPKSINRLQILYSKFGMPGETNSLFKPGSITILIKSICVY